MRNVIYVVSILVFIIPSVAGAVDMFGIGPRIGYYKVADADEGNFLIGAAARLRLSPLLGIEGSIDYRSEKYANGLLTIKSWPVMASAIIYPLPIVYGLVGAGWYNTTYDYDLPQLDVLGLEDKTEQEFGWHFGGGVELPMGIVTTLAADIRYTFIDYDFSELPGSEDMKSDFFTITVSILFGL